MELSRKNELACEEEKTWIHSDLDKFFSDQKHAGKCAEGMAFMLGNNLDQNFTDFFLV